MYLINLLRVGIKLENKGLFFPMVSLPGEPGTELWLVTYTVEQILLATGEQKTHKKSNVLPTDE